MTNACTLRDGRPDALLLLDVPVILQSSVTSCALASVSGIVCYLTGRLVAQRQLAESLGQRWTIDGTRMEDACVLIERFADVVTEQRRCTTFAVVTDMIRVGRPMLAALHIDRQRGHMVTVAGVVTGRTSAVIVNDPNFRWRLLIPWSDFSGSLTRMAFVGGVPNYSEPLRLVA